MGTVCYCPPVSVVNDQTSSLVSVYLGYRFSLLTESKKEFVSVLKFWLTTIFGLV